MNRQDSVLFFYGQTRVTVNKSIASERFVNQKKLNGVNAKWMLLNNNLTMTECVHVNRMYK